jgi:hypothetical protein
MLKSGGWRIRLTTTIDDFLGEGKCPFSEPNAGSFYL